MSSTCAVPGARANAADPFHTGEQAVQRRMGVREALARMGPKVIREVMPDQHRELFEQLPILFVGSLDEAGRPWASVLVGRPGFIASPDSRTLIVSAQPGFGDPLGRNLASGAPLAVLGIQLETRRRNRANGRLREVHKRGFTLVVGQSFGNCPKYIQARAPRFIAEPETAAEPKTIHFEGRHLSSAAAEMIGQADAFFIASASGRPSAAGRGEGVDISHRGGPPGFVRVDTVGTRTVLTVPDFSGNFFFNTLGNIAANPRAGILVLDFDTGRTLTLTGRAEIDFDAPEIAAFAGAERLLRFYVEEALRIDDAVPLRWSAPLPAPQFAALGAWPEAAESAEDGGPSGITAAKRAS